MTKKMKAKERRNLTLGNKILYAFVVLFFTVLALSYLYIFFFCFTSGLKTHDEITLDPFGLPANPRFMNYIDVFTLLTVEGVGFFEMILNSLYFSVVGYLLTCMLTCMLAYVTNKYKFPGARWYFLIVTFTTILPIYGNGGSMYRLLYQLNFINSPLYILMYCGGINVYYLYFYATFSSLSWSYAEAAQIDGANEFTIFFRVMFPQVINLFGALFLIGWVADWNNYSTALVYLPKMPTLAAGIYIFELNIERTPQQHILYAAYFISALPALILFIFFNKTLMSNVSLGGIKE